MYTHNCCCIKVLRNKPDASDSITVLNLIGAPFADRSNKKGFTFFLNRFFFRIFIIRHLICKNLLAELI